MSEHKYILVSQSTGKRVRLKDDSLTPVFDYPIQGMRYIDKHLGGSNYIRIKKLKR